MKTEQHLTNYIATIKEELSINAFENLLPERSDRIPKVGDIWLLKHQTKQTLVLITFHDDDVTRGVLLENEISIASQEDVLILPTENTLKKQL